MLKINPFQISTAFAIIFITSFHTTCKAQLFKDKNRFTHADTLRGTLNINRSWWDVLKYDIQVEPDINAKTISGKNDITFLALDKGDQFSMQIDLQQPMHIDDIILDSKTKIVDLVRDGNAYILSLKNISFNKGSVHTLSISFSGKPREAVKPPWDGGWIWKKDANGNPWVSVACQGLGASVWYPCKDHQSDEPNQGATLSITAPKELSAVGNGKLVSKKESGEKATWTWAVKNPINNYNIIPYIGKYAHIEDSTMGINGLLSIDYWVLDYNVEKAKKHFGDDVKPMLHCFEYWMGPYPFYEDGYKLVESPHLGMEHQSAVAYGNQYKKGYLGHSISSDKSGEKWDFIIVHESGHEWFGNNITTNDIADMWVHEGFTNYTETLFTECILDKPAADSYLQGLRSAIKNDVPIKGTYGVNNEGSGDMYNKGANLIHNLRSIMANDSLFRSILMGLQKTYRHKTVTSKEVENYISSKAGYDFSHVFEQYLETTQIPKLEYSIRKNQLTYKWTNCMANFNMPMRIQVNGKSILLKPTTKEKSIKIEKGSKVELDKNFYIQNNV